MDCTQNTDPLKLVREGTSQAQRTNVALTPTYAPVNERTPAHGMVFARAFASYLQYYNIRNVVAGNWTPFFSDDISVLLAVAAVQDVDAYRTRISETLAFLNNRSNRNNVEELKNQLGYLFSYVGTLAMQIDVLSQKLPTDSPLKNTITNLIKSQLSKNIERLISYYKAGLAVVVNGSETPVLTNDVLPSPLSIFGAPVITFNNVIDHKFSLAWSFQTNVTDSTPYGQSPTTVFEAVNHIATHNLFTSILDQFLKAYARIVSDANVALEASFTKQDNHQPHYALFLAFLRLMEYARQETNTLTAKHLDFYYRDVLRLREKPAEPSHAHLLIELAKQAESHLLKQGDRVKAGKDDQGKDAFFANDRDFVANKANVTALKSIYRHIQEDVSDEGANAKMQVGRLFASPVANSDDGEGKKLTSVDESWHPFANKYYVDGSLSQIRMPKADVGFAIASPYLYLTEGHRNVAVSFELTQPITISQPVTFTVQLTTEKGWLSQPATLTATDSATLTLSFTLEADQPAILPYNAKLHGGQYATAHPVLKATLNQDISQKYAYSVLETAVVKRFSITVQVGQDENKSGLRSLAVSNDFGPVDVSKPFQPFGPMPKDNEALIIGSKEVFQKANATVRILLNWRQRPGTLPTITTKYLNKGAWGDPNISPEMEDKSPLTTFKLEIPTAQPTSFDYTPNEHYSTTSVSGFLKLSPTGDFGYKKWQDDLAAYFKPLVEGNKPTTSPPSAPAPPEISSITLGYTATSGTVSLDSSTDDTSKIATFYHVLPFGIAQQGSAITKQNVTTLLPQFSHATDGATQKHEAEFYIGIASLNPPQTLSLLIQVADGTANPNAAKPKKHLHWSYLQNNNWVAFESDAISDTTNEFTRSGIVTLAINDTATTNNTLLPAGMHWIRVAVTKASDAVCKLISVAAQAVRVTFENHENDPAFTAKVLPAGTISKLDQPDTAIKKITQPFETFGGRGRETSAAFYTRVSERLRHKDRAITLWDYEQLVLEAFPQIYRVKCLNHTHYEPSQGIYKELAPGHITLVTLPNLQFPNQRDPLKPFTSLGLLTEIETFLARHVSCFVKLHVKNPEFESVRIKCRVKLYEGYDETYYIARLQEAITRFLSPWAFVGTEGLSFGGKIQKSVLINFVEEQPYVDYVTDFQLFHDTNNVAGTDDKTEIEPSKAVSILVSVPAKLHTIQIIHTNEVQTSSEKCPCEA